MIKVLHLRDTDKICGPGKTILETISAIDKDNFDLTISLFLLNREKQNIYYEEALKRKIPIIPIRTSHQYDPSIIFKIGKLIKEHNFQIIHSHEYKSDLIAFAISKLYGVPIVTTLHGWITNTTRSKTYIGMQKLVLPYFDKVIAVSEKTRNDLINAGIPKGKIKLIYNAIVVEKYQPSKRKTNFLREQFGLPAEAVLIGNIGRLSPEKGQKDFLLAAKEIIGKYNDVYFILVGDGPDRKGLERLAYELKISHRVFFTGQVQYTVPVYQDLDIIALTSYTEGFPNVILESFCMEKPVLATNVGGVSEIIEDKISGVLVPPHSPESISQGLQFLLENAENSKMMAMNGKNMVIERFQFKTRVKKIQELYEEILNERN